MKQIALVLSLAVLFSVIGCIPSERRVTGGVVAPPAKETATVSRLGEKFDPYPYLPKDGKVAKITPAATNSYGAKGSQEAVIFQDIDNDNIEEVVVFYTTPEKGGELPAAASANVVVLKEQNGGFKKLWEDRNPAAGYISHLSGVRDINGDGKPEIIAARWVGASFGGYFDIFQWNGDKFVKLNGGWDVENDIKTIELKDVAGDGTPEIIISHRFSNPDIYKWEKDKYSLVPGGESQGWLDKIEVEVRLGKDEFIFGEPVKLCLKATNLNAEPVYVWDRRGWNFAFIAKDSQQKLLKDKFESCISWTSSPVKVPAGADFSDVTFLNSRYIDFPGPGEYAVTYKGYLYLQKDIELHHKHRTLFSGDVNVKIRKGSDSEIENRLKEYLTLLKSKDNRSRSQAIRAFAASKPKPAIKLLRETLEAVDSSQRIPYASSATWALGKIGTDEAIGVLLRLAKGSDNITVRTNAIGALRLPRISKEEILLVLTDLLSDPNARVRIAVLRFLSGASEKSRIPQVELLLNDPEEKVREAASKTLERLTKTKKQNQLVR